MNSMKETNRFICRTNSLLALTLHGVRFPATRLAIRKEDHIVAIQSALYKFGHLIKDTILTRRGREDLVKLEVERLATPGVNNRQTLAVGQNVETGLRILSITG